MGVDRLVSSKLFRNMTSGGDDWQFSRFGIFMWRMRQSRWYSSGAIGCHPAASPIAFKSGSLWVAEEEPPLNEYVNRLYVGSVEAGHGL